MAVIGKIQKNSLLLLVVVGLAMLAFIFTDFIKGGGSGPEQIPTATLYGDPIDEQAFRDLKDDYVLRAQNDFAYQQKEFTDADRKLAENDAFNELVRKTILNQEFEKLGIVCTPDELNDMILGDHIHPWVRQIPLFNGPGGFSKDSVQNYITTLEIEPVGADDETMQGWKDQRKQWKNFEDELKSARQADKYVSMIRSGLYVNKLETENQYSALYSKKQVKFVMQRYRDIPEEEVTLTDEDLKAFYEEHKNESLYEQEESAAIRMVYFPIQPTAEDMEEIKSNMETLKEPFKNAVSDIGFVYQNSDSDYLSDSTIFKLGMGAQNFGFNNAPGAGVYPEAMDEMMQNAETGDVVGPFMAFDNKAKQNMLVIAKVTDTPTEKQAWVRHILIGAGATRTEERAKEIADSVMRVIRANDNFVEMVNAVSEDPGSKQTGGEYKWFDERTMVPEFTEASFNGPIGKLQLVKTAYGYHIVEVLGQADRKTPKLAVVGKFVKPSETTIRRTEERAYDFIYQVTESAMDSAFSKIALDSNMTPQATKMFISNEFVIGMAETSKIMKFAFNAAATEGEISNPILDDGKYVVAILDNKIEEGVPAFEDIKEVMRAEALKEKQAEKYIEIMSGKNSLEEIGELLTYGGIQTAELSFDSKSVYNGGGQEPAVIGALFRDELKTGNMTVPIQGKDGVYVFIVESETPAPETTDTEVVRAPLEVQRKGSADQAVIQGLREKADLEDNRKKIEFR